MRGVAATVVVGLRHVRRPVLNRASIPIEILKNKKHFSYHDPKKKKKKI